MFKKAIAALSAAAMCLGLWACSADESGIKAAMVTSGMAISDNHTNQSAWEGLERLEEEYRTDINNYRPQQNDTESFMVGVKTLVEAGYNTIIFPGPLFAEAFEKACREYPSCTFIAVDCSVSSVPENGAVAVFDKSQAGFMAGLAAACQLENARFGGVFGVSSEIEQELLAGFVQGINYAADNLDINVTADEDDLVFVGSRTDYPSGQRAAAYLYDSGVNCLLVSSDPTGMGAASEGTMRRQAGDDVWIIGSDADYFQTAMYDTENKLSCALTSALCDYGDAVYDLVSRMIEGDRTMLGDYTVYGVSSGAVGLPEENPNISKEALELCTSALEEIKAGDIVIKNTIE